MKYIHNYRSCTRTYSTLRIYPQNTHPNVVSDLLKIKPSKFCVVGQLDPLGDKAINGWFLSSKGKIKSRDSRRHIDWILDKIEPVAEIIQELQRKGSKIDIMCFWGSASGNGGPVISPEQMARLVKMNLAVWWDVYFEGEEEDEDDNKKDDV
jgi:hypothetical protein